MSPNNIQNSFDQDLQQIQHKIILMAEMVSQELADSIQAFSERDKEQASDAVAADDLIDASERIIDKKIIQSIVLHQPIASECRQLIGALRISRELERIGDYAATLANHSTTLDKLELTGEEQRVIDLGHAVHTMTQEVIEAYADQDAAKAELVRQQDIDIDELYTKIFSDLLTITNINSKLSVACTHLSFISYSLERIGDHTTNIAEEILFMVEGEFPEDDRPKADGSAFLTTD